MTRYAKSKKYNYKNKSNIQIRDFLNEERKGLEATKKIEKERKENRQRNLDNLEGTDNKFVN